MITAASNVPTLVGGQAAPLYCPSHPHRATIWDPNSYHCNTAPFFRGGESHIGENDLVLSLSYMVDYISHFPFLPGIPESSELSREVIVPDSLYKSLSSSGF